MCKHSKNHPASPTRISRCSSCGGKNLPATEKSLEFNNCDHCYQMRLIAGALANDNLSVEEYEAALGAGERA